MSFGGLKLFRIERTRSHATSLVSRATCQAINAAFHIEEVLVFLRLARMHAAKFKSCAMVKIRLMRFGENVMRFGEN